MTRPRPFCCAAPCDAPSPHHTRATCIGPREGMTPLHKTTRKYEPTYLASRVGTALHACALPLRDVPHTTTRRPAEIHRRPLRCREFVREHPIPLSPPIRHPSTITTWVLHLVPSLIGLPIPTPNAAREILPRRSASMRYPLLLPTSPLPSSLPLPSRPPLLGPPLAICQTPSEWLIGWLRARLPFSVNGHKWRKKARTRHALHRPTCPRCSQ